MSGHSGSRAAQRPGESQPAADAPRGWQAPRRPPPAAPCKFNTLVNRRGQPPTKGTFRRPYGESGGHGDDKHSEGCAPAGARRPAETEVPVTAGRAGRWSAARLGFGSRERGHLERWAGSSSRLGLRRRLRLRGPDTDRPAPGPPSEGAPPPCGLTQEAEPDDRQQLAGPRTRWRTFANL